MGEHCGVKVCISIHALREESDYMATAAIQAAKTISIHALREESDLHTHLTSGSGDYDFNPRSP